MTNTISAISFRGFGKLVAGESQCASPLAVEPIGFLGIGAHDLGVICGVIMRSRSPERMAPV
jgi:hypothetical protein